MEMKVKNENVKLTAVVKTFRNEEDANKELLGREQLSLNSQVIGKSDLKKKLKETINEPGRYFITISQEEETIGKKTYSIANWDLPKYQKFETRYMLVGKESNKIYSKTATTSAQARKEVKKIYDEGCNEDVLLIKAKLNKNDNVFDGAIKHIEPKKKFAMKVVLIDAI